METLFEIGSFVRELLTLGAVQFCWKKSGRRTYFYSLTSLNPHVCVLLCLVTYGTVSSDVNLYQFINVSCHLLLTKSNAQLDSATLCIGCCVDVAEFFS